MITTNKLRTQGTGKQETKNLGATETGNTEEKHTAK